MRRIVLGVDVDVVGVLQQVLGAEQRVGEGFVRGVDEGRERERFGVCRLCGMLVWVVQGLDLEKFAAKSREGDREGAVGVGWGAEGQGAWEEGVVV